MSYYPSATHSANPSHENLAYDSSYHRRSHSQSRVPELADNDDIALLDKEKRELELYDPYTRSGRPSMSRSAPSSPMMTPNINVEPPTPLNLQTERAMHRREGRTGTRPAAKFMARFRFLLITIGLVMSGIVVGCNAFILATYNSQQGAGKFMNQGGSQQVWWDAWPKEGIDMRPITAYLAVGAFSTVLFAIFFIWSAHTSFRYMEGAFKIVFVSVMCLIMVTLWTLLAVFLQFQAVGNSGKHSFRTWACSHTDKDIYGLDQFSFGSLCTEADFSRWGGIAVGGTSLLVFITILLGCCVGRRGRQYEKVQGRAWAPRWVRR